MIFSRLKPDEDSSVVSVHIHEKCIIFNLTFDIDTNELFEFKDYEKLLFKAEKWITKSAYKSLKEYLESSDKIKPFINNGPEQLSLF